MARSSSDAGIQDAFTEAKLTRRQRSLLHTVLRALNNSSGLGFHGATSDSALVALVRAHDALRNHSEHGQPREKLLLRVLRSSISCARSAQPIFPGRAGREELQAAVDELASAAAKLENTDPSTQRAVTRSSATALEQLVASIAAAVADLLHSVWNATAIDLSRDARTAAEIAVSVYIRGRDWQALKNELTNLLAKRQPTASEISALLWPPLRCHYVTVMVSGTRSLDNLDRVLPGSRQWRIPVDSDTWPRSDDLCALLAKLSPVTRTGVLVRIPVDATDMGTAVVLGRRALNEALDQYIAGNRIADLAIEGPWQVSGPDDRWMLGEPVKASVTRAAPLSTSLSEELRPALRIAHIAQRVEAPMTSSALCWSAIESTGLAAEKSARLARAYALQTLRQQIIDAHTQLRLAVSEEVRRRRSRAKKAKKALRDAERALAGRAPLERTTPAEREALSDTVVLARQSWLHCEAAYEDAARETTALMEIVNAHVPIASRPNLTEPDRWLDLLLPARGKEELGLVAARRAVTALANFAGGLTEEAILLWRERLERPTLLAAWLQQKQETCHALLEWLYSTRNIAFHNGRFAGPVDVATAHAGCAIVDVMLEILGRWHSTQQARGQDTAQPAEILKHLAQRKETLSSRLNSAPSCHQLSIQHLTGPDEDYWSATR